MSEDRPEFTGIAPEGRRYAIVASRFNLEFVEALIQNACQRLEQAGVQSADIEIFRVPGSAEIPCAVAMLIASEDFDCILTLGVVIAGETPHAEIIGNSTAVALQQLSIDHLIPVINGIVVVHDREQAEARCVGPMNRGAEFGASALAMAALCAELEPRFEMEDDLFGLDEDDDILDFDEDDEDLDEFDDDDSPFNN